MKAIVTRYLGHTNKKGARIKATAEGVPALTISRDAFDDVEDAHLGAATALANKYGWLDGWSLASGTLPNGDQCHVFVKSK